MSWNKAGALFVLTTLLTAVNVNAQATGIVVRTFNNYGLAADALQDAQTLTAASLKRAGIDVAWIDCWDGDRQPAQAPVRCSEPVGGDLVLRLQRAAPGHSRGYISLGFSLVMAEGMPFLATVYVDLAEGVARRAGVESGAVLGRAIAHEIGHLLLNTNSHAAAGLMRAAWSQRELRRDDPNDWRFLESEVATMRAAVAARSGEQTEERRLNNE
jgi:hypothetical protein